MQGNRVRPHLAGLVGPAGSLGIGAMPSCQTGNIAGVLRESADVGLAASIGEARADGMVRGHNLPSLWQAGAIVRSVDPGIRAILEEPAADAVAGSEYCHRGCKQDACPADLQLRSRQLAKTSVAIRQHCRGRFGRGRGTLWNARLQSAGPLTGQQAPAIPCRHDPCRRSSASRVSSIITSIAPQTRRADGMLRRQNSPCLGGLASVPTIGENSIGQ